MKKLCALLFSAMIIISTGCTLKDTENAETSGNSDAVSTVSADPETVTQNTYPKTETAMKLKIGNREVPVTWEDNASIEAIKKLLPIEVSMSMYGGFEQVGSIGESIVRNDKQMTTSPGDIVLYSGNQIVIFYGSNSWSYTKLGHVELSQSEMTELLSNGDVTVLLAV